MEVKDSSFGASQLGFTFKKGFPSGSSAKESICYSGAGEDSSSIPGLGRSPGGENGNPVQYSCQENPMDWQATVQRFAKHQAGLSTHTIPLDSDVPLG